MRGIASPFSKRHFSSVPSHLGLRLVVTSKAVQLYDLTLLNLKGMAIADAPVTQPGRGCRRRFDSEIRVTAAFALRLILPKKNNDIQTT